MTIRVMCEYDKNVSGELYSGQRDGMKVTTVALFSEMAEPREDRIRKGSIDKKSMMADKRETNQRG